MVNPDTVVFIVNGGLGKCIAATAVARNLKRQYDTAQLVVVSPHAAAWLGNPHVDFVIAPDRASNFYDQFIAGRKPLVLEPEPYRAMDYILKRKHLVEVWCEQCGVSCDDPKPELHLFSKDRQFASRIVGQLNKPIFLIQSVGGAPPETDDDEARFNAEHAMHKRSLPHEVAQGVVDRMRRDYVVVQVRDKHQRILNNSLQVEGSPREIMALIPYAEKMLFIDSFMQHAAAALGKPAVVCWAGTSPDCLGYKLHTNLRRSVCETPECHRPNTFLFDQQVNGDVWNCPVGEACRNYSVDEIVEALTGNMATTQGQLLINVDGKARISSNGSGVERVEVHP